MAPNSVFERLSQIADISSLTKEERIKYDSSIKQYRDALNGYEGARLEGKTIGEATGEARGRAEGVLSTARNMKAKGFSTELTPEAIQALCIVLPILLSILDILNIIATNSIY